MDLYYSDSFAPKTRLVVRYTPRALIQCSPFSSFLSILLLLLLVWRPGDRIVASWTPTPRSCYVNGRSEGKWSPSYRRRDGFFVFSISLTGWKNFDFVNPLPNTVHCARQNQFLLQKSERDDDNDMTIDNLQLEGSEDTGITKGITDYDERVFIQEKNYLPDDPNTISIALLALSCVSWIIGLVSFPILIATLILFALLRTLASQLILLDESLDDPTSTSNGSFNIDDVDPLTLPLQWKIDGVTFVLSFFSSELLVPSSWVELWNDNPANVSDMIVPAVFVVVVVSAIWFNAMIVRPLVRDERLSEQDKLLNLWDRRYSQQNPTGRDTGRDDELQEK